MFFLNIYHSKFIFGELQIRPKNMIRAFVVFMFVNEH